MSKSESLPQAWIGASVKELRHVGSWTGRIHVYKLLSVIELVGLAQPPFEFELDYSRDFNEIFGEMQTMGYLDWEYPKPGYGPRYTACISTEELNTSEKNAIRRVAEAFGKRNSTDIELIVACLWMEKREGIQDVNEIVQRVHNLKPMYTVDQIRPYVLEARKLQDQAGLAAPE